MQDIILIAILCVICGVLAGALFMSKSKNKQADKKVKTTKKTIEKQPIEFSKKILMVTFGIAIVIIAFTMFIIYTGTVNGYGADSSNLNTLLGGLFAEITAGTSFYYWKSRRENEIKLKKMFGEDYSSDENNY